MLLHGHGRLGASVALLARAMRRAGYATLASSYAYRRPMGMIVADLAPRIAAFADGLDGPLHYVGHSLGGLVIRALLASKPSRVGRVVTLGSPHGGSELADLLIRLHIDRLVLGHAGAQLRTDRASGDVAMLGDVACEVGVIAGSRALLPIVPARMLARPHDGKVSVAATRLKGMADHMVLPVTHTLMVYDRRVIRQTLAFLEHGRFVR